MKCDIRTTIGLALIAAVGGIGVTLAILKDIQLRTDLFSTAPSADADRQTQVSSSPDEPDAEPHAEPETRSRPSSPAPQFEVAQSGLNAPDHAPNADGATGSVTGEANSPAPTLSGSLNKPRPGFDPTTRLAQKPDGSSSGKADRSSQADAEDNAAGGNSNEEGPAGGEKSASSGSKTNGNASEKGGEGARSAKPDNSPDQAGSDDAGTQDGQTPSLKSLGEVDYGKMSQDISQLSNTLEQFNQKLMKAIGHAKKKQQKDGEAAPKQQQAGEERKATEGDGSDGEGSPDIPPLPEIEIEPSGEDQGESAE